jgi:hypothetical protein
MPGGLRGMPANSAVTASRHARESRSSSTRPSGRSMVDTGTGTAPVRSAARKTVTNSGESAMNIISRCSGRRPAVRSPAAVRTTRSCNWA